MTLPLKGPEPLPNQIKPRPQRTPRAQGQGARDEGPREERKREKKAMVMAGKHALSLGLAERLSGTGT
jgi:hypothetical protein